MWDFNETWIFSTDFRKISQLNFMKPIEWEPSCSMRTDGRTDRQTDMANVMVAFRNFANAPNEWQYMSNISCDFMLLVVITLHEQLVIHCLTAWITALCYVYFSYFSAWTLDVFIALQMFWLLVLPSSVRVRCLKQFIVIYNCIFLIIHVLLCRWRCDAAR